MSYTQAHDNTHVYSATQRFNVGVQSWLYVYILIHIITEDHLTLPNGLLHTFSSSVVLSFFKLYYYEYSIEKKDLIKQKLEIEAVPWRAKKQ